MYVQYNKEFNYMFDKHYRTLNYHEFYTNLYSLGGSIDQLREYRQMLISSKYPDKETRRHAKKFMTEEIKEYKLKKEKESALEMAKAQMSNMNQIKSLQAKKRRERREKIGKYNRKR